jgi:menaquinone-dependent protoporphyrinogen oxidase
MESIHPIRRTNDGFQGRPSMSRILIVYGSTEGQTRKIVRRVAEMARGHGCEAVVLDSATNPPPVGGRYDAVIVAGSIHAGRHQKSLVAFVQRNRDMLRGVPNAFVSVSLTAAHSDAPAQAAAQACVDRFVRETQWHPRVTWLTAGALMYSRYGFFKKRMMRWIAKKNGGDTDTSRDYEYTDWERLERQVDDFLEPLRSAADLPLEAVPAAG